jgi:hypothetical protein
VEKTRGQKSRATVPLRSLIHRKYAVVRKPEHNFW